MKSAKPLRRVAVAIYSFQRNKVYKAGTALAALSHGRGTRVTHGAVGKLAYAQSLKEASAPGLDIVTDYTGKAVLASGQSLPDGVLERDIADVFRDADAHKTKTHGENQGEFKPIVASELIGALPHELSLDQNIVLVTDFSKRVANEFRTANAWGIHPPDAGARTVEEMKNVHVHVTTLHRHIEANGNLSTLNRDFDDVNCWRSDVKRGREIRETATIRLRRIWEQTVNDHLERAGRSERIDMRSNKVRGIDKQPGKHRGAAETRRMREETRSVSEVRKELMTARRDMEARMERARERIRTIQDKRRLSAETPGIGGRVGSVDEWQQDTAGAFARAWKSGDRAAALRRDIREARRVSRAMRDPTQEEARSLRGAGREERRAERLMQGIDMALSKVGRLGRDARIDGQAGKMTKEYLQNLTKAIERADDKQMQMERAA